jgi:hypothetical protein
VGILASVVAVSLFLWISSGVILLFLMAYPELFLMKKVYHLQIPKSTPTTSRQSEIQAIQLLAGTPAARPRGMAELETQNSFLLGPLPTVESRVFYAGRNK